MEPVSKYSSIAQRAAASYLRSLIEDIQTSESIQVSQRELKSCFRSIYTALFEHPEQFGLPVIEDDSFVEGEPDSKGHKAELNKKLKKPRELISAGMDFLRQAGLNGRLDGQALVWEVEPAGLTKKSRGLPAFWKGLETAGLEVHPAGGCITLTSSRFPAMMPALQTLANACAAHPDVYLGAFLFSCCDFRALQTGYVPGPMDLYRILPPDDFERVSALHQYFVDRKYTPSVAIRGVEYWMVQYQGSRKIKSTPFFQVEYQERYRDPVVLMVKCASTNRIASLLPNQPQALQDDFFRRVFRCQGTKCDWCKNNKTLGPSTLLHDGEELVVCWYSNPTLPNEDSTVALVKEYAVMHEALA
jgi:hypothetical protein